MISFELIIYCLVIAGTYLLIISGLTDLIAAKANLTKSLPSQLVEKIDLPGFLINYLMEMLFMVVIPSVGYSIFYLIIPLEGIRAGLAIALIAFTIGAVPIIMVLSVRIKLPINYLLFLLLTQVLKLAGCLAIIAHLHSL